MTEEVFYRGEERGREPRRLPGEYYNLTRQLLHHSSTGHVFVPIRDMQYLAVIERDEIIFVSSHRRDLIEIAWAGFRPQARDSLDDPVPFTAIYYDSDGEETMKVLSGSFYRAMQTLLERMGSEGPADRRARILSFSRGE